MRYITCPIGVRPFTQSMKLDFFKEAAVSQDPWDKGVMAKGIKDRVMEESRRKGHRKGREGEESLYNCK